MIVELNGQPRQFPEAITLRALVESVAGSGRGSAVAVDGEIVPRTAWPTYRVHAGQVIELITAVQGG